MDRSTKTIKREDLTNAVVKKVGLSVLESKVLVDDMFDLISEALKMDGEVKLRGFGTFTKQSKAARLGRNPKTGEEATVSARNVISYHASKLLVDKINRSEN